ncbi:MAG: DUF1989 domain-containing protein, partial [Alphaproteobacteria bacterium]|nr:DUF1989 domain-containing protein [Alphaproteobacteria bacterium]
MTDKPAISGNILEDTTIAARAGWSRVLKKGEMMRIIDLEGKQAVDFLCWNANDHEDRYAAADTMKINETGIFLGKGTTLYSVGLTPLLTIVEDSCGFHDTIGGCCSADLNKFRYDVDNQTGCRENFLAEMEKYGLGKRDMAANVNFFMYVPVGKDGDMDMGPSISKPGDFVDLRADSDVLAVISNCPQINNPVN